MDGSHSATTYIELFGKTKLADVLEKIFEEAFRHRNDCHRTKVSVEDKISGFKPTAELPEQLRASA